MHGLVPVAHDLAEVATRTTQLRAAFESLATEPELIEWVETLEDRAASCANQLNRLSAELGYPLEAELQRFNEQGRAIGAAPHHNTLDWDRFLVELTEGEDDE